MQAIEALALGILPWGRGELGRAIRVCKAAHVGLYEVAAGGMASEGAAGNASVGTVPSPLDALRRHVWRRRLDFVDLQRGLVDDRQHDHETCPGYVHRHADGTLELLFLEPVLRRGGPCPSVKRIVFAARISARRPQVIAVLASASASAQSAEG